MATTARQSCSVSDFAAAGITAGIAAGDFAAGDFMVVGDMAGTANCCLLSR